MQPNKKTIKPGINKALVCKKCGYKMGYITLKPKIKWRTIKWAIGLGFTFNLISELIIYFIFR